MSFTEILLANGGENPAAYQKSVGRLKPLPDAFSNPLCEKLKMHYVTGGMPEPVCCGRRRGTRTSCMWPCPISSAPLSAVLSSTQT